MRREYKAQLGGGEWQSLCKKMGLPLSSSTRGSETNPSRLPSISRKTHFQTLQIESENDPKWRTPVQHGPRATVQPRPLPPPQGKNKVTQCRPQERKKRKGQKRPREEKEEPQKSAKKAKATLNENSDSGSANNLMMSSDSRSQSNESSAPGCSSSLVPKVRRNPPRRASFTSLYTTGEMLGEGGCGVVYEGMRIKDGRMVAIKFVPKHTMEYYLTIPGATSKLPLEVALMQIVSKPPTCEYVVKLIEWFEQPKMFILILERPIPCVDLFDFTEQLGGKMDESLGRKIMMQVILAVRHCRDRGVLHRDIKVENLLVNPDTMRVKLIDFGCGDLLRDKFYRDIAGTQEFYPPEWLLDGRYQGCKATIWSLGILLFHLVCGTLPFRKETEIVAGQLCFKRGLSKSCKDLIRWCLTPNPLQRPVLEQILLHDWFSKA